MPTLADRLAAMDPEKRRYTLETLPTHLAESGQPVRLRDLLTTFEFVLAKVAATLNGLVADYRMAERVLAGDEVISVWGTFLRERLHVLSQGGAQWPPERVLLQLAAEYADSSPITQTAEAWLAAGSLPAIWLRRASRPAEIPPSALIASIPVSDMVLDMAVDAAGTQAVVLTGAINVNNTVTGAALWQVDLQTLQAQRQVGSLHSYWGMRLPENAASFERAPSVPPWWNPESAPRREERLAALALGQVAYSADADMAAPIYFINGGRQMITGTHDGVIRLWDADALDISAEKPGDPAARAALDEARDRWSVQESVREMMALTSTHLGVPLDAMDNPAHNTTQLNWAVLNRDLSTLRVRFDTPHRLELWRIGEVHPLACWISDVPLIKAQYDNVMLDASMAIRAMRVGSGLAVETTAGDAFLIEVWRGNHCVDLAVLDQEGK